MSEDESICDRPASPIQAANDAVKIVKAKASAGNPFNNASQDQAADGSRRSTVLPTEFLLFLETAKTKARSADPGNDAVEAEITKKPFRLLALPTELLLIILNYVLGPDVTAPLLIYWPALLPAGGINHSILFTNKLLRKEAFDVLGNHRTFTIISEFGIPLTGAGRWELAQWIRTLRQRIDVKAKDLEPQDGKPRIFVTVTVPGPPGGLVGTARQPGPLALWNTRDFPMLRKLTLDIVGMGMEFDMRDEEDKWQMSKMAGQLGSCILHAKMGIPEPKVVGIANGLLVTPLENAMKYSGRDMVTLEE